MRLIHPVNPDYVRITQEWKVFPIRHSGRDYGWVVGQEGPSRQVRAAADGRVVRVISSGIYNQGYGNQIIIQHTTESWTTYNHLENGSIKVKVGDIVKAEQHMAQMGATGKTVPVGAVHLHFELRLKSISENSRVNPAPYFKQDLPGTSILPTGSTAGVEKFHLRQTTTTDLNLRAKASTKSEVLLVMPRGRLVHTGKKKGDFEHVRFVKGGKRYTGYAHAKYLVYRDRRAKVDVNLRSSASLKGRVIATIPKGKLVTVTDVSGTTDGSEWYKVTVTLNGKKRRGWAASKYLGV